MKNTNKNALLQQRNDIQQKRADQLDLATKAIGNGDTAGYDAAMEKVKGFNTDLTRIEGLISECEKEFITDDSRGFGEGEVRVNKSGITLMSQIRGTEKYMDAWMQAMKKGISPEKGVGVEGLAPLYEAETALKALTISGGDTSGADGGFLVPIDFDNRVIALSKDYVDLSNMVTVENVSVNAGWRVVDASGIRTKLTKVDEMARITEGQKPKFKQINFDCSKYGDKVIVSNELKADAPALIQYLAGWWTPKYIMTKNDLILAQLNALTMQILSGTTDAEQIKALKHMINTGLNTANSKKATILTNCFGYDAMDNWYDNTGKAMLVPDPKGGDFDRFKGRRVDYADLDLIPNVESGGAQYMPFYIGNLKQFCRLFLRQGTRIKSTDIGGDAWATDSWEVRCTTRMDCKTVDENAAVLAGLKYEDAAAAAASEEGGES